MLRDAFLKGLRDQLRPFVMWAAGVAFYVALLISIYPSIRKSAGAINEYVKNMPEAVRAAFMGSSDFTTPVGYVNVELALVARADRPHRVRGRRRRPVAGRRGGERDARPRAHARRRTPAVRAAEVRRHDWWWSSRSARVLALADRRDGDRRHAGRRGRPRRGLRAADAARPGRRQRHLRRGRRDGAPAGRHRGRRRRGRRHVPAEHARGDERDGPAVPLRLALPLGRRRLAARARPSTRPACSCWSRPRP